MSGMGVGANVNTSHLTLIPKDNRIEQTSDRNILNASCVNNNNNMTLSPMNQENNDNFNSNFFKSRKQSIMKSPMKELVFTLYKGGDKDDDSQECSE